MATVKELRVALAAAIDTIGGLDASPYMKSMPTPPYAHVYPAGAAGDVEYDQAMGRGLDLVPFTVEVFTGAPFEQAAQDNLDAYLTGEKSIKTVLEADKTLGGLVDDLRVTTFAGYDAMTYPGMNAVWLYGRWYVDLYVALV